MTPPRPPRPATEIDPGTGNIRLRETFTYADPVHHTVLQIPAGFECDRASIPRPLRVFIEKDGIGDAAAVLHDALYRWGGMLPSGWCWPLRRYTRAEADMLFREVMRRDGVKPWRWPLAYAAVRSFGWMSWKG